MKNVVIRDTREKKGEGWIFIPTDWCQGTITGTLKTGDYSIQGYEEVFCIERKGSASELAQNITQKRFEDELKRMQSYEYSFILLEFDMSDVLKYPEGSGIPKSKWKYLGFKGGYFLKRILELELRYPKTKIIFCGKHGLDVALSLMKRFTEKMAKDGSEVQKQE